MVRTELNPVIQIPISLFRKRRLIVTTAMDSPKERMILSMTLTCLKKTSVQAKPGTKKTNMNPRSALRMGSRSRKGKANSNSSLSQSTPYIPVHKYFNLDSI